MFNGILGLVRGLRSSAEKISDPLSLVDLRAGDIAIDCGANVGSVTDRIAKTGARIFAFEPNPYAFEVLEKRFRSHPNVQCINKGVLDRSGTVRLYLHEQARYDQVRWSVGSSMLEFKGNIDGSTFVDVEVIDLCGFITQLDSDVKFVKMDVEGVECQIINKLIDTKIIDRIGTLIAEMHDQKIPELRREVEQLRKRLVREKLGNIHLNWI